MNLRNYHNEFYPLHIFQPAFISEMHAILSYEDHHHNVRRLFSQDRFGKSHIANFALSRCRGWNQTKAMITSDVKPRQLYQLDYYNAPIRNLSPLLLSFLLRLQRGQIRQLLPNERKKDVIHTFMNLHQMIPRGKSNSNCWIEKSGNDLELV